MAWHSRKWRWTACSPTGESRAAGLPVEPELIVDCGPAIEDGYQAALRLLALPARPTAILAINDLLAIGVLRAAGDWACACLPISPWSASTTSRRRNTWCRG